MDVAKIQGNINPKSLLLSNARRQAKTIDGPANSDASRVDRSIGVDVPLDLGNIHVTCVLGVNGDTMVLLDEGVKHIRKVLVRVPIPSINSAVLVIELNCTGDSLAQGELGGLGLELAQLLPQRLRHVLGNKRMFRLNLREVGHLGEGSRGRSCKCYKTKLQRLSKDLSD